MPLVTDSRFVGALSPVQFGDAPAQEYRLDIDGLRAVAIAGVLAYHAWPRVVPGGFLGVDLFFVISGYLITDQIARQVDAGGFSFVEFAARRIRRLFPALVLVLAAVMAAAIMLALPDEFRLTSKAAVASTAFAANVGFYRWGAGYFAPTAETNPLLHLWSLGIEEQFYLLWPLVLVLVSFAGRRTRFGVLIVIGLASLAWTAWRSSFDPSASFYLLPFRAWELSAGGVIALARLNEREVPKPVVAWLSGPAALIIVTAMVTPAGSSRVAATIAIVGSTMILVGAASTIVAPVLRVRPLVATGRASYALYLWHWPLLVFVRLAWPASPTAATLAALIAAILLAAFTYRWIESPIRRVHARRAAIPLVALGGAVALVGLAGWRGKLLPMSASVPGMAFVDDWFNPPMARMRTADGALKVAVSGSKDPSRRVLFIGDSHMQQYWPRVEALSSRLAAENIQAILATAPACPALPHVEHAGRRIACDRYFERAMRLATDSAIDEVVIGSFWEAYFLGPYDATSRLSLPLAIHDDREPADRQLRLSSPAGGRTLTELRAALDAVIKRGGTITFVSSSAASSSFDPRRQYDRVSRRFRETPGTSRETYEQYLQPLRTSLSRGLPPSTRILDPLDFVCSGASCPAQEGDAPLYRDEHHLRASTARRLTMIDSVFWATPVGRGF